MQPSAAGSVQVFSHHGLGFTTPVHKWKDENYATPIWFGQGELRLLLPLLVLVLSLVLPLLVLLLSLVLPLLVLLSYCCYHCWCCCRHWCYHCWCYHWCYHCWCCYHTGATTAGAAVVTGAIIPLLLSQCCCYHRCYTCHHTAATFAITLLLPSQCCLHSATSAVPRL